MAQGQKDLMILISKVSLKTRKEPVIPTYDLITLHGNLPYVSISPFVSHIEMETDNQGSLEIGRRTSV